MTHDRTIPDGWYMLTPSSALRRNAAVGLDALGTRLTARRDARGRLSVRDAAGNPRLADDVNQMVLVWHGRAEPTFRVEPLEELADPRWTRVAWGRSRPYRTTIENVQRDVVDNAHFEPVHKLSAPETRAERRGPYLDTISQGVLDLRRFGGPPLQGHIRLSGRLHGPGLLVYRNRITLGVSLRSVLLSAPLPLDRGRVQFHCGLAVPHSRLPGLSRLLRRVFRHSVLRDYARDAVYWETESGRYPAVAPDPVSADHFALYDRWLAQYRG